VIEPLGNESLALRLLAAGARKVGWALGHAGRLGEWRRIAAACGLTNVSEVRTLGFTRRLEADAGWLRVVFTSSPPREDDTTRGTIVISGLATGLHGPTGPGGCLGGFDVPRGLADIPPVGGPPLLLCALFDAPARRLVSGLFEGRVDGEDGVEHGFPCRVRLGDRALTIAYEGDLATHAVQGALRAARCLVAIEDPATVAADTLRREPQPSLRVHIVRTLAAHAPEHPATAAAIRTALADVAEAVRLEAALASGQEGRPVLQALIASGDTTEAVLARAVTALGAELSSDEVRALLSKAIARRRTRVAIACVELLGGRGPGETDALVSALRCADPGVMIAAAEALTWHADTREAVIALREAEALGRGDRDLAEAVRHAVTAVQLRLERAGVGQLSVAGPEAGTLSLADDVRGHVALPAAGDAPSDLDVVDAPDTGR
jgi:hypothetical protein